MTLLAVVFAGALAGGLVGYAAWTVWLFTTKTIEPAADMTTKVAYFTGRGVIWVSSMLLAGGVFGLAAATADGRVSDR